MGRVLVRGPRSELYEPVAEVVRMKSGLWIGTAKSKNHESAGKKHVKVFKRALFLRLDARYAIALFTRS